MALPLWLDVTPEPLRGNVTHSLLSDLMDKYKYHATTGIIGIKYMFELLSRLGRTDVAVKVLQQKDYPSFGFMLHNEWEPATTIWERWNAQVEGPGMNSRNHIMFGGPIGGFFYKFLGGIQASTDSDKVGKQLLLVDAKPQDTGSVVTSSIPLLSPPGYREVVFAPPINPCMDLQKTSTSVLTAQGTVSQTWESDKGVLTASIQVPVGATARVIFDGGVMVKNLNAELQGNVTNATNLLRLARGLEGGMGGGAVEYLAPSGSWEFKVTYEPMGDCTSQVWGSGRAQTGMVHDLTASM